MEEPKSNIDALLDELDQSKIKAWFNSLKQQSALKSLEFFRNFSKCLLDKVDNAADVLLTIETIRPVIHQLDSLSETLPPEERANFHLGILNQESAIYEKLLNQKTLPEDILPQVIHRCLSTQIQIQLTYYKHYLPIPEKEWLLIHRLFFRSIQNKIAGFTTSDNIHFLGRKRSIVNLYTMSLLLGCGRLNHLTPAQIRITSKSLQDWCTMISISRQPSSIADNQLVVDITSGSAPHFKKLFTPSESSVSCYLQVDKLIDTLNRLLPNEDNEGETVKPSAAFGLEESSIDPSLILHLRSAWSEYIYREERQETQESLTVCSGFFNVHYHICGSKMLKQFIGAKVSLSIVYEEDEDITTIEKQRSTDVWSAFTTIPDGELVFGEIPAEFNFQHFFEREADHIENEDYPETEVLMTDHSPKGCCLLWPAETQQPIEVGELIGLRKNNKHHLQVGEVAWKDLADDGSFRTGIRILSSKAIPIAVDVPLSAGSNQNFAEAILLPAEESLGTDYTSFLSQPDYYKKGSYLSISQKGIEEKIHLSETITDNAYFARFKCGFIIKAPVIGIDRSLR